MYVYSFILLLVYYFSFIAANKLIVETTHGKVQGKVLKTFLNKKEYSAFMGIPFAKPPVGKLRFLPPQPIDPWEHTLVATKEKQACLQFNNNVRKGQSMGIYGVEDCLYLDIFTPNVDNEKRSVVVFLYNERLINSYNKTKDYGPDFFIEEDVIIVTLSHRLAVLGFLSLENEVVPGNAGLKDVVAALNWTKKNIGKFGGDPEKITLLGSQGGAAVADLLLQSNAKNMFQSVILQGASSWATAYLQEDVLQRAFKLGDMFDRKTSSKSSLLIDLQELSVNDLLRRDWHASPDDYFKENQRSVLPFGPVVEKQPNGLITQYPEDNLERINIPIMIGFNSREGLEPALQYLIEPRYLSFVQKDYPFLFPVRFKFKFDPEDDTYFDAVDDIKNFYYKKGKVTINSITEHVTYMGDVVSAYTVDFTVRLYSNNTSSPLYYYYFDYFSDLNENKNGIMKHATVEDGTWGSASGDELCYLFFCPSLKDQYIRHNKLKTEELKIHKTMVKLWTNFIKFGNPTPHKDDTLEDLKWPTYDLNTKKYLDINKKIEVKSNLCRNRFEFWDNFFLKWEQRTVNGTVKIQNKKDEL